MCDRITAEERLRPYQEGNKAGCDMCNGTCTNHQCGKYCLSSVIMVDKKSIYNEILRLWKIYCWWLCVDMFFPSDWSIDWVIWCRTYIYDSAIPFHLDAFLSMDPLQMIGCCQINLSGYCKFWSIPILPSCSRWTSSIGCYHYGDCIINLSPPLPYSISWMDMYCGFWFLT